MRDQTSRPFFGPGSPYLSHPLLTPERSARELDEIERLVGPVRERDVLDIGCGFGRHSIEAARRGARAVAIDPSPTMVEATRAAAESAGVAVDARCARLDEIDLQATHDIALCLFTTLGQRDPLGSIVVDTMLEADQPDRDLVAAARRALRSGGMLIVEAPHRDRHVAAMVPNEVLPGAAVTRRFDRARSVIEERFETDAGDYRLRYRLYHPDELLDLLHRAGFEAEVALDRPLVSPPASLVTIVARTA